MMKSIKQTSNVISHLKESERKWTDGDEMTGKHAREEGKGDGEKISEWA